MFNSVNFDWKRLVELCLLSRALDECEETVLRPKRQHLYQFSARGHELCQVVVGMLLNEKRDVVGGYYRSRPLLLTLGLEVVDALRGTLGMAGGCTNGRDSGVLFNMPGGDRATVIPMSGGVGSQYSVAAGWAHALRYYSESLKDVSYDTAIAVAMGGDGSIAAGGFWAALNIATTRVLPMLFVIEDNSYAVSVPSILQTPGGLIAENLASFRGLTVFQADSQYPIEAVDIIFRAISKVRNERCPVLLHLSMPRLNGHSGYDDQAYKHPALIEKEQHLDPLERLRSYLVPSFMSNSEWWQINEHSTSRVRTALDEAIASMEPDKNFFAIREHLFADNELRESTISDQSEVGSNITMLAAIRQTLQAELRSNPLILIFGQDVGLKGGIFGATRTLQRDFGARRVFDTSLSEEGIVVTAVGMAQAGLRPIAEIQFRKYADSATEQLNDCGTLRWRTCNRFTAPIVVRMPGGVTAQGGDPWHSSINEAIFTHAIGWQVLCPSNAEDAVGLLRSAMRSDNPSIFLEHRSLLFSDSAKRGYPGDSYKTPIGIARIVRSGHEITVVTWGAMVEKSLRAAQLFGSSVEVIDLRCLIPWDRVMVVTSVLKTHRCIVVHEDTITGGFGAEIVSALSQECFLHLDAPIARVATPDLPIPYNVGLMQQVVPTEESIAQQIRTTLHF